MRAGLRTTRDGTRRQLYYCKDCRRRFSNSNRTDKRTASTAILEALTMYCQGYSYADIAYVLQRKHSVRRTRSAICKWVKEYDPPYLAIRERMKGEARPVRSYLFTHRDLNYMYQVHLPKLRFTKAFPGLADFLTMLPDRLRHDIFDEASHCSNLKLLKNPGLRRYRDSQISRLTAQAAQLAPTNRMRHQTVENYLLSCDRNTIAVEVPVYFYDRRLGTIAGHVDLLQITPYGVQILDYKPSAAKEHPGKVTTQLTLYANALRLRADVPLNKISCGYFDEHDLFTFRPQRFDQANILVEPAPGGEADTSRPDSFELYPRDRHGTARKKSSHP